MDIGTQPSVSFIPKAPLASATPSGYRRSTVSITTLVAVILFIASVALAASAFIYEKYLSSSLIQKQANLEKARAAFDPALIEEIRRLDRRIEHSKEILSRHAAFSSLFDTLGRSTLQNVQFKSFDLTTAPGGGSVKVSLKGLGRSYASVALQSDAFNKTVGIKDPIFSELNLDQSGKVLFSVTANLDSSAFKYGNLLSSNEAVQGDVLNSSLDGLPDPSSESFEVQ